MSFMNAYEFAVTGFAVNDSKFLEKGGVYVYNEELLSSLSATAEPNHFQLVSPLLGEWPVFVYKSEVEYGKWLVTNCLKYAETIIKGWGSDDHIRKYRVKPGYCVEFSRAGNKWFLNEFESKSLSEPDLKINDLNQAMRMVEQSLFESVNSIKTGNNKVALLLSAGVDSGILCSLLDKVGFDVTAISIKTPWGNELEGAQRTADFVGIPLTILELSESNVANGVESTVRWLQSSDAEIVLIQLLITIAHQYASQKSMSLVTGLGSDLLNSTSETGMENSNDSITDRISYVSGTGLMQNGVLDSSISNIYHPYWQEDTIQAQLSVDSSLKFKHGFEKYYLRKLAEQHIPAENAFGVKTAIHTGSNLSSGVRNIFYPESFKEKIKTMYFNMIAGQ